MKKWIFALMMMVGFNQGAWAQDRGENVLGYMAEMRGMWVQVLSHGCTDLKDFEIRKVYNNDYKVWDVALFRKNPDVCLALRPYGVNLFLSYDQLGLQPGERMHILNAVPFVQRW